MANDIDMWNDLEKWRFEKEEEKLLRECYNARYIDYNATLAEKLKIKFNKKYGYWNDWY